MNTALPNITLDQLFRTARTAHGFLPTPIAPDTLNALYDVMKWGPTAFNSQPARIVFVQSAETKARLRPALMPGNVAQTMAAPVTAIVAYDTLFFEHLPALYPAYDAKALFANDPVLAEGTALRNSTLQGAYLMIAARALGLDVGPQSGFDPEAINTEFFADGRYRANFLVNIGYADPASTYPRGPRLPFDVAAQVL